MSSFNQNAIKHKITLLNLAAEFTDTPNQAAIEDAPEKLDIVLIGDSHAFQLYPGLTELLESKVGVFPSSAQAPFPQIATCTEGLKNFRKNGWRLTRYAYDFVLHNQNTEIVILAHHPECSIHDTVDPDNPDNCDSTTLMENAMRQSLIDLAGAGKKVLVVLDNPTLNFDPNVPANKGRIIKRSIADANPARQWYNAIFRKVVQGFDNVYFVDLFDAFCDADTCISSINGEPLYLDANHLNYAGSKVAAPIVVNALQKMAKH